MKKKITAVIVIVFVVLLILFSLDGKETRKDFFAMDTVISVKAKGFFSGKATTEAEKEILRLHDKLSVNGTGELYIYNVCGEKTEELSFILSECERLKNITEGAFDAGIYSVSKLWGFTEDNFRVPSKEEIEEGLEYKGTEFDLGAIAKGYGADRVREILSANKIKDATVSLGGTVLLYGDSEKTVAIASPDGEGYAGYIKAQDVVISTSGGYERYFEENGERYSHIINPETGYPAKSGIISATVISGSGTESDAFSTAVFVMGEEKAEKLWKKESFEAVIITGDGRMIITEGIESSVTGIDDKYEVEIWEK